MAISKKIRFEVFKRDSFTCQYCGNSAPNIILEVDHIQPVSKGGSDDIMNLITSCFDCNRGKSDRILSDDAAINKKITQLNLLNERKNQLEMLYEYQSELLNIENDTIEKIDDIVSEIFGFYLSDVGKNNFKKYIKKFGFNEIIESMKICQEQYCILDSENPENIYTNESVELAIKKLPLILNNREKLKNKPYLKDLYYIRGILKNRGIVRLNKTNYYNVMNLLEILYNNNFSIDEIKLFALSCNEYQEIVNITNKFIKG